MYYDFSNIGTNQCAVLNATGKQLQVYRSSSVLDTYLLEEGSIKQFARNTNGNYANTINNAYCQNLEILKLPVPGMALAAALYALTILAILGLALSKTFGKLFAERGDKKK